DQAQDAVTEEEPKVHVVAGMFFDGTGNNAAHSLKRIQMQEQCIAAYEEGLISRQACEQSLALLDESYHNDVSNIAKLSDLYIEGTKSSESTRTHYVRLYVDGIGTKTGDDDSLISMGTGIGSLGVVAKVEDGIRSFGQQIFGSGIENVDHLTFDVFGFSRGAAAARHFVNEV